MSQLLDALYDELEEVFYSKRGYVIPSREAALVEATGGSPTYGEITGEGIQQFLNAVPLQNDDVLVDLGSGLGRLTLQVACSARLRRCVGIELSATRHEQACWVAERLGELAREAAAEGAGPTVGAGAANGDQLYGEFGNEAGARHVATAVAAGASLGSRDGGAAASARFSLQLPGESCSRPAAPVRPGLGQEQDPDPQEQEQLLLSPVELRCDDLMTADLADGSAFFLCSTAFSAAACRAIAERLAAHPRFRLLVTSRALPFPSPLTQLGQFRCSFTWTAAGTAYVYVRSLREAPASLLAAFLSAAGPGPGLAEEDAEGGASARGGIAWLPSLSTMTVVPGDLMV